MCLKNIHIPPYSINSRDYLSCTYNKVERCGFLAEFQVRREHVLALEPSKYQHSRRAERGSLFGLGRTHNGANFAKRVLTE